MADVKVDLNAVLGLIRLGSDVVMRWRAANAKPLDDAITAEEIMEIEIHDTDAAIAEGEEGG